MKENDYVNCREDSRENCTVRGGTAGERDVREEEKINGMTTGGFYPLT